MQVPHRCGKADPATETHETEGRRTIAEIQSRRKWSRRRSRPLKGQSHPPLLLLHRRTKESCFTRQVRSLPRTQITKGPPLRSLAPAHIRSTLGRAQGANHRTPTSPSQMMGRASSPLMRITRMIPKITGTLFSSVRHASSSLNLKTPFGIMSVFFAKSCSDLIARFAIRSSMTGHYSRNISRVSRRFRVNSV